MGSQLRNNDGYSLWISRFGSHFQLAIFSAAWTVGWSLILLSMFTPSVRADVQTVGVVYPATNNPFTGGGLPQFGNFIDGSEPANAAGQTNFEGLSDINVGQDPTNSNVRPFFGEVLISSNTELALREFDYRR